MELKEFVEGMLDKASQMYEKDKHITPVCVARCAVAPEDVLVPLPFTDEQSKRDMFEKLHTLLTAKRCERYVIIAEATMRVLDDEESAGRDALVALGATRMGECVTMVRVIEENGSVSKKIDVADECIAGWLKLEPWGGGNA